MAVVDWWRSRGGVRGGGPEFGVFGVSCDYAGLRWVASYPITLYRTTVKRVLNPILTLYSKDHNIDFTKCVLAVATEPRLMC